MSNELKYESDVVLIVWDEVLGIFKFKMKDSTAVYDELEVKNQFDFFEKYAKNKPYKVLVDTRGSLTLPTEEAFEYFFSNNNPKSKNAIIAEELSFQLLMGQMYKIGNVQNHKLFKKEEEAINWLLED